MLFRSCASNAALRFFAAPSRTRLIINATISSVKNTAHAATTILNTAPFVSRRAARVVSDLIFLFAMSIFYHRVVRLSSIDGAVRNRARAIAGELP